MGATAAARTSPQASLAKIPIRAGGGGSWPLLFIGTDGKLSVACMYLLHVAVWTQQGGDESGCGGDTAAPWLRTTVMNGARGRTLVRYTRALREVRVA